MIITSIIIIVLLIIAAISKAVMDTLIFRFKLSIFNKFKNQKWWNPAISWKNKYKNCDSLLGPAFFGSTTFLVFLTDAWHLFQMIMLTAFNLITITGLTMLLTTLSLEVYQIVLIDILAFVVMKMIFGGVFELFWNKIFKP